MRLVFVVAHVSYARRPTCAAAAASVVLVSGGALERVGIDRVGSGYRAVRQSQLIERRAVNHVCAESNYQVRGNDAARCEVVTHHGIFPRREPMLDARSPSSDRHD